MEGKMGGNLEMSGESERNTRRRRKKAPSRKQAMLALCHECMAFYADGKRDCQVPSCPLYWWMPYRKLDPDLSWQNVNPLRKGLEARGEAGPDPDPGEERKAG